MDVSNLGKGPLWTSGEVGIVVALRKLRSGRALQNSEDTSQVPEPGSYSDDELEVKVR